MLETHSPIPNARPVTHQGVTLSEAPAFTLTQVAGEDKVLKKALSKIPAAVGKIAEDKDRVIFRIGANQFWILGDAPKPGAGIYITPLSSGRTRFLLEGEGARDVLASCALIDFHASQFKPGAFVMTGIHHTPVTIHCIGPNAFHIYALRTFAQNVWEWLADVMEGLPHD